MVQNADSCSPISKSQILYTGEIGQTDTGLFCIIFAVSAWGSALEAAFHGSLSGQSVVCSGRHRGFIPHIQKLVWIQLMVPPQGQMGGSGFLKNSCRGPQVGQDPQSRNGCLLPPREGLVRDMPSRTMLLVGTVICPRPQPPFESALKGHAGSPSVAPLPSLISRVAGPLYWGGAFQEQDI